MIKEPLITKEHKSVDLDSIIVERLEFDNNFPEKYLGLLRNDLSTSYYIGCKWLIENEYAIVVEPKIKNIDYLTMFLHCFNSPITSDILSKIYKIDLNSPTIKLPAKTFELTPFIIIHFLNLLKKIVKKGLKRDYVWIEENLSSKIKGKILMAKSIKHNIVKARVDRNYCKYQEYSYNCIENKILKKTLNFVSNYLKHNLSENKGLINLLYFNKKVFDYIEDYEVTINSFKLIKTNSLYQEYNEALKVAKMILKRFDYSINQTTIEKEAEFPPFHIDMSLLFEIYSFSLLHKTYGNEIKYQYHGKYGEVDFLNTKNRTIIDAKYKVKYANGEYEIKDIRQLSGYSRDINVIKKVGININKDVPIIDCVIVYPDQKDGSENIEEENFINPNKKIEQFYKFYKYGIKLPEKK
ncbi:MAG: hypothetical protein GXO79_10355 [Chlorobi bacterium]|nr:hypothetical protein [Chlorobiota bacterium]